MLVSSFITAFASSRKGWIARMKPVGTGGAPCWPPDWHGTSNPTISDAGLYVAWSRGAKLRKALPAGCARHCSREAPLHISVKALVAFWHF